MASPALLQSIRMPESLSAGLALTGREPSFYSAALIIPAVARPLRQQARGLPVNKQDLIVAVAEAADLPRTKASEVVDAVFGAIEASLKKKQDVRLVGFGTFSLSKRKAGMGRNPRTGEEIKIAASTTVRFKAGKGLKDAVG